jgi:ribosomal protein S9
MSQLIRRASLMMLLGAVVVLSSQGTDKNLGPGHDRWTVKTSAKSTEQPKKATIAKLKALDPLFAAGEKESKADREKYDKTVHPKVIGGFHEGQIIAVQHAYVQLLAREAAKNKTHDDYEDADYHIQINDSRDEREGCYIVEIPDPQFVPDADLKAKVTKARADILKLLKITNVSDSGNCIAHPVKMTLVGQLFWDSAHSSGTKPGGGRGKKQCKQDAATLWELHPIFQIIAEPNTDGGKPALSCQ